MKLGIRFFFGMILLAIKFIYVIMEFKGSRCFTESRGFNDQEYFAPCNEGRTSIALIGTIYQHSFSCKGAIRSILSTIICLYHELTFAQAVHTSHFIFGVIYTLYIEIFNCRGIHVFVISALINTTYLGYFGVTNALILSFIVPICGAYLAKVCRIIYSKLPESDDSNDTISGDKNGDVLADDNAKAILEDKRSRNGRFLKIKN